MQECKRILTASLLSLCGLASGCATQDRVRLVEVPCPPQVEVPSFLMTPPPEPNFQSELLDFFSP